MNKCAHDKAKSILKYLGFFMKISHQSTILIKFYVMSYSTYQALELQQLYTLYVSPCH